jgi:hypothetical protein
VTEADIDRIGAGLRDRTLPKAEWTHAAHFAAAVWVITHPELVAERDMPGLIRAYNEATGGVNSDTEGYHETITQASIRAARAWLAARPRLSRAEALDALLAGPFGRSDWLLAHWSRTRLFSVEARRGWLDPDLSPLPF